MEHAPARLHHYIGNCCDYDCVYEYCVHYAEFRVDYQMYYDCGATIAHDYYFYIYEHCDSAEQTFRHQCESRVQARRSRSDFGRYKCRWPPHED